MTNNTEITDYPGLDGFNSIWLAIKPWLYIVITILAVIGNVLTIIVFLKFKNWGKRSIHYLFNLAVADLANMVFYFFVRGLDKPIQLPDYIFAGNTIVCKLTLYIWYIFVGMATWLVAVITIERWFLITFPIHSKKFISVRQRKIVLCGIVILSALADIIMFEIYEIVITGEPPNTRRECYRSIEKTHKYQVILVISDMGVFVFGPMAIIMLFNTLLCINLLKYARTKEKNLNKVNKEEKKKEKKEVAITRTLVLISSVYILSNLPYLILWVWFDINVSKIKPIDLDKMYTLMYFCTFISMINHTVNFIIYAGSMEFFWPMARSLFSKNVRVHPDMSVSGTGTSQIPN